MGQQTVIPSAEREAFSEVLGNKSGHFPFNVVLVLPTSPFPFSLHPPTTHSRAPAPQEQKPEIRRELQLFLALM